MPPTPPHPLQRDVLLASSTVREALTISALLKLPRTLSHAEKMARVDAIIQELVRGWAASQGKEEATSFWADPC